MPSTLKRQVRQETARPRAAATRSEGPRPAEDRAAYRRAPGVGGPDKKADVGAGTGEMEFVSIIIFCVRDIEKFSVFSLYFLGFLMSSLKSWKSKVSMVIIKIYIFE